MTKRAWMTRRYRLERRQFVPRARRDLFAFFANAEDPERLTPAFLHFRILTPRPIRMRAGAIIDHELRLYGVPVRWRTRIETFEPESCFTNIQLRGPYRHWHHRHEFVDVAGGTEMRDVVDYGLPLGFLGVVARRQFVGRTLERIFDSWRATLGEVFGAP